MADHKHTNRLAHEASPYLQQHAHNPVDWYPWGAEAFERARSEGRPIFLSVGYSTCYWCHVMERESFENEAVASDMNRWFVNIKVDREERPDVDQLYMTAVQLMTRSGGWPMSVFLTPDLQPFYCGTYFPPRDVAGRPGMTTLLRSIAEAWSERRPEVEQAAESLTGALRQYALPGGNDTELTIDAACIDDLIGRSVSDYDPKYGGFGGAPKFPRETLLELLLVYSEPQPVDTAAKADIRRMLSHTLEMMARGGIRDQLGGAFHRYSTDQHWLVPHFEIMLYDNAMLLGIYAYAAAAFGRKDFAEVGRGIADFIITDMTGPEGQFYTALDAEVDGREGASYLWTPEQVAQVLTQDEAVVFSVAYGLDAGPNFQDPHHGSEPESSVLYMPLSLDGLTKKLGSQPSALEVILRGARAKLLEARRKRKGPLLDTKVLTHWNALMIRGMAMAGRLLDEPRYIEAAARAMEFLLKHHRAPGGGLYRVSREGHSKVAAFLDDYAATARALLELHHATSNEKWLAEAEDMSAQMMRRFSSSAGAMYFTDAGAEEVLVRQIVATDSPLPSGNATAAQVLLAMGRHKQAAAIIAAFAGSLETHAESSAALVQATMEYVARHGPLSVSPRDVGAQLQSLAQRGAQAVKAYAERLGDHDARITVEIAPGFHIYASQVPAGLYPTQVSVNAVAQVTYPEPTRHLPLPDGGSAGVYEGSVTIEIHSQEPLAGAKAVLQVQPCSDAACLTQMRLVIQL